MSDDWTTAPLSEVSTLIKRGRAPSYLDEGGIAVVSQKCVQSGNRFIASVMRRTDNIARPVPEWAMLRQGDILVNSTGRGTLGRACFVADLPEPEVTADSHVSIVRANNQMVLPTCLGLVLAESSNEIGQLQSGSTSQTELSPSALGTLVVPIPPLTVQARIVDLMGALDAHIGNLEVEKSSLANVFESQVELLGQGSVVARVGDVINSIDTGKSPRGEERPPNGDEHAVLKVSAIQRNRFDPRAVKTVAGNVQLPETSRVKAGDVLFVRCNGVLSRVGQVCVVDSSPANLFLCDKTLRLNASPERVSPEYLAYSLMSRRSRDQIEALATGSDMRNLAQSAMRMVEMPVCDLATQVSTTTAISATVATLRAVEVETESLIVARSALLSALLNREMEIPESYDELLAVAS